VRAVYVLEKRLDVSDPGLEEAGRYISQPLFQVSLIRGLWFTPLYYISRGKPPLDISIIIITFKRKARVWGREVSLEWMSSQLPI
jgi:hypothetical protein